MRKQDVLTEMRREAVNLYERYYDFRDNDHSRHLLAGGLLTLHSIACRLFGCSSDVVCEFGYYFDKRYITMPEAPNA